MTTVLNSVLLILAMRLLAAGLGPEDFGAYGLARRVLNTLALITIVPLGVAGARYVALERDTEGQKGYLLGALTLSVPTITLILITTYFFGPLFARLIFHDASYATLLLATVLLLLAQCFYTAMFAYYRGRGTMTMANLWSVAILGIAPVLAAWLFAKPGSAHLVMLCIAALTGTAAVPILIHLRAGIRHSRCSLALGLRMRELAHFTVPRMPGGLTFSALLSLAPLTAGAMGMLTEAGYLVIGLSVLQVADAATATFSLLALPKVAQKMASDDLTFLRDRVHDVTALAFHMGLFITIQLLLWSRQILEVWLGPQYLPALPVLRVTILAVLPYLVYGMLRSIIDALDARPVNMWNTIVGLLAALATAMVTWFTGAGVLGLAVATAVGMFVLGSLSINYLRRKFPSPAHLHVNDVLATFGVFTFLQWLLQVLLLPRIQPAAMLGIGALSALLAGAGSIAILRLRGVRWLGEIETRLFQR